jgi:hypothetical protein
MLGRICPILLLLVLILFLLPSKVFAANLLSNPGFEESLSSWILNGNTATFSAVSDQKHNGNNSVKLSKENSSSWAYFYQRVPIETDKYYRLSGWLRLNDNAINNGKLRFYWLTDNNGTKLIPDPVETVLTSKNSDFQFTQTDIIKAPEQSMFAEIQGYVYLNEKNPQIPLLFDDFVFENTQPTPTPSSTPSPQSTPTSTPTKSPTPELSSANATPKPSTPVPSVSPTKTSLNEAILGVASESASMSSLANSLALKNPKKQKIILPAKEDNTGKILILLGFVFILACVILFSWPHIRKKLKKDE